MDVERTIEYIVQMQARAEERMAKADQRAAKADERAAKADQRMDKFDKRLEATRKIIQVGMKLMAKHDGEMREIRALIKATAQQQRKTERTLDRFIASLTNRRSNGHKA